MKFINKNQDLISLNMLDELIIKAVKKINQYDVNIDLKQLKGDFENYYRIRKGNIRIIFNYTNKIIHIVNVLAVDFRGNIY